MNNGQSRYDDERINKADNLKLDQGVYFLMKLAGESCLCDCGEEAITSCESCGISLCVKCADQEAYEDIDVCSDLDACERRIEEIWRMWHES